MRVERMLTLRGQAAGSVVADATLFRNVTTTIFTAYQTSGISLRECRDQFWDAFEHLLNGKPVDTLPAPSLDPEVRAELTALTDSA